MPVYVSSAIMPQVPSRNDNLYGKVGACMNKEQIQRLQTLCNEIGGTVRSYSGRGMYGRECVSICLPNGINNIFSLGLMIGEDEELTPIFTGSLTQKDDMGLGCVIYWPHIQMDEPIVEEES